MGAVATVSASLCVRCGRPTPDGYACSSCANRAGGHLHDIADMAGAARDVAHGFARRGPGGSGTDPRLPLNLAATQRLDAVQNMLTGWARHVGTERGVGIPFAGGALHLDQVVLVAQWLPGHVEWIRHRKECDEFLADVEACARIVAGIARGPASQRYLGPCGAPTWCDVTTFDRPPGSDVVEGAPCPGDIYAREGAQHGACRTCGATVGVEDRRAWLDAEVRSHAFRASQIAEAYGVNVNTIRSWAARGQLKSYWRTEGGIVAEWTEPREGEMRERLHYVGDVLDLAAADAARRATEQAKRARRVEARRAG
jgi:hypothetical protein